MSNSWQFVKLEDVQDPKGKAIVSGPFGSNIGMRFFVPEGVPVIRGNNLTTDMTRFIDDGFVFITEEKAEELKNCEALPGDLVFTAAGSLGQVGIIPDKPKYPKYIISNKQLRARLDPEKADRLFVFFWLSSPQMVEYVQQQNTGSSVPLINLSILRKLPIPLPPLPEQRAIAGILGALDDKIELNRRMNRTLESMARAVFRQWFVENEEVESWKVGKLGDVVVNFDSRRVPLSKREREQRQGKYPYYGAASIMDYVDDYLFDGIYVLIAEDGSVIGDDDHPVLQYVWGKFWVNNHAHVLQGTNGICNEHLYLFLKEVNILPYVTGAVQPKLNQANMNSIPFVIPPKELSKKFEEFVSPLFAKIRANDEESRTLASLRDALLPKLMRGDVRVAVHE